MHLTASGKHIQPDTVWNDTGMFASPAASGSDLSTVFKRPSYQSGVTRTVGSRRGVRTSR